MYNIILKKVKNLTPINLIFSKFIVPLLQGLVFGKQIIHFKGIRF